MENQSVLYAPGTITIWGQEGDPQQFTLTGPFAVANGVMTFPATRDGAEYVITIQRERGYRY